MKIKFALLAISLHYTLCFSQWKNIPLPASCLVHSIRYAGDKLCIGTSCGVYINLNASESVFNWKDISPAVSNLYIYQLTAVDHHLIISSDQGILVGKNFGEEWIPPVENMNAKIVYEFAVDYENRIYAATDNGIWRSSNAGLNWKLLGLSGQQVLSITVLGNQTGYLAGTSVSYGSALYFGNIFGDEPTKIRSLDGNILKIQETGDHIFLCGTNKHNPFEENLYSVDLKSGNNSKTIGFANSSVSEITTKGSEYIFIGMQDRGHWDAEPTTFGVQYSRYNVNDTTSHPKWEALNKGLNNLNIHSFLSTAENIFAGTEDGLYSLSLSQLTNTNDRVVAGHSVQYTNGYLSVPIEFQGSSFRMYDVLGQPMIQEQIIHEELCFVGNIPQGTYIVTIHQGSKRYSFKCIPH